MASFVAACVVNIWIASEICILEIYPAAYIIYSLFVHNELKWAYQLLQSAYLVKYAYLYYGYQIIHINIFSSFAGYSKLHLHIC